MLASVRRQDLLEGVVAVQSWAGAEEEKETFEILWIF
jgi:hypothetical protein